MSPDGLFSSDLLSPEVSAALPAGYAIRALRATDFDSGFLDCLRVLTTVGDVSREAFVERYEWMVKASGTYYILVVEDTSRGIVVGTGALIVERKLYVFSAPLPSPLLICPFSLASVSLRFPPASRAPYRQIY